MGVVGSPIHRYRWCVDKFNLTARELNLWRAVKILSDVVFSRIESGVLRACGLSGSEFSVLSRLHDLGDGKLGQQDLLQSLKWNKSRLSHQLTRMEAKGFVRREPAGRTAEVVMLAAGKRVLKAAQPAHAQAIRQYLSKKLTREEADTLLAIFEKLSE
ncbi:MarR family winged helix-turn-helix transcriptional regulator [Acidicapsa ligni]|uniref:MarR family winged helix-turn-helix transcriptional regulator n=1 Tax=Acidicapsa ligni TaxID=542300 RepID=UPI0021E07DF4|nr:MarR family transcriptional regulator [Acidicapsa ligni]